MTTSVWFSEPALSPLSSPPFSCDTSNHDPPSGSQDRSFASGSRMGRIHPSSRTGLACVAAFGIILLVFLPSSSLDLFITSSPIPQSLSAAVETPPTVGRWSTSSSLPSFELSPSSLNPISARYGLRVPGRCFVPHVIGRSEQHHIELEQERFNEIGKWDWIPSSGRPLRDWDVEEFVGRLINSPRGLVFVGDSITQQQHSALLLLLTHYTTSPPLLRTIKHHDAPKNGTSRDISSLNLDHPLVLKLRKDHPFIPFARWSRPILSFYRHDLLLSPLELRSLLEVEGIVEEGSKWEASMPSATDDFWLAWEKKQVNEEEGWKEMEQDIVVLNSGAHWSERTLGVEQGLVPKAFRAMVNSLLPRFLSLPNTLLIVRSTSTPHLNCETYTSPGTPALDEEDTHPTWGWNTFGELDRIWSDALVEKDRSGSSVWMNVTDMSWTRPDAHSNKIFSATSRDCLHWCVPIVPHWWNRVMWDLLGRSVALEVERES